MTRGAKNSLGDISSLHAIFFEEADEHLAAIEEILLRMDRSAPAADDMNAIFRAAHSIKGTSVMLGFSEIGALTHVMENLLDRLRNGERPLTHEDVDAMLRAGDVLKMQVAFRKGTVKTPPDMDAVADELRALAEAGRDGSSAAPERHFSVRLGPLTDPIEDAELETMLSGLGEMGQVRNRDVRNSAGGEIRFEVSLSAGEAELRSVLSLVVAPELIEVHARKAPVAEAGAAEAPHAIDAPGIEDPGLDLFVTPQALRARRASDRKDGGRGDDEGRYGRRETDRLMHAAQGDASSIRVSVEKIDHLVNLVGELVITEAMVAQQYAGLHGDSGQGELAGLRDLARHTRNLQEAVMSIRMVPIAAVFTRFPRLVRELSQRLGKEVELVVSGETTELDRGLIEKIIDPLTHLVRNAIDHGLETAEERIAAGKPRRGVISLAATQRGGNVVIEVSDDGRGLDRERIIARAAQRGVIVAPDAPDQEVWQHIFEPGFTTAGSVTDVSGRGVGMDVVRRNIQLLRGNVELSSRAGAGTTVTVSVPLTLAIIEAMTVGVSGATYALPLASVIEVRQVAQEEMRGIAGQGFTLRVRDDYLPVQRLGEGDIAIIVEVDGARAALLVDELIGQQQIVVKSLEANFRKLPGFSGATIMGDGRVALIVDVAHAVNRVDRRSRVHH
jgi:two-component system chemotaxis sensor kinase CheA